MKKYLCLLTLAFIATGAARSADNKDTTPQSFPYGIVEEPAAQAGAYMYAGTSLPYYGPGVDTTIPDSLETVFVSHVGRHGARFLSSDKFTRKLSAYLDTCGPLSPIGRNVCYICNMLDSISADRWGALDAMGFAEQDSIGHRFAIRYADLLKSNDSVSGYASYVPRCIMSMDAMTHALARQHTDAELSLGSGKRYNYLLRFFNTDSAYLSLKHSDILNKTWRTFTDSVCPTEPIRRLSETPCSLSDSEARDLSMALYSIVSGCMCITDDVDWRYFFKENEYRQLWECSNLKHYLTYSWSGISDVPVLMAKPLLDDIRLSLERAAAANYNGPAAIVRFGHAETMMPLLGLLGLPGCRYITSDWNSVSQHWQDCEVAPMAVNLQLALCRSKATRKLYLTVFLNEERVLPIITWEQGLEWLNAPNSDVSFVSDSKASR